MRNALGAQALIVTMAVLLGLPYQVLAQTTAVRDPVGDAVPNLDPKLDLVSVSFQSFDADGNITLVLLVDVADLRKNGLGPPVGYDAYGWIVEFILANETFRVQVSYEPGQFVSRLDVYVCKGAVVPTEMPRPLAVDACTSLNQWPEFPNERSAVRAELTKADLGLAKDEGGVLRHLNMSSYVVIRDAPLVGGWREARVLDSSATGTEFVIQGPTDIAAPALIGGPGTATRIFQANRSLPILQRPETDVSPGWDWLAEPPGFWLISTIGSLVFSIGLAYWGIQAHQKRKRNGRRINQEYEWEAKDYKERADNVYLPMQKELRLWTRRPSVLVPSGVGYASSDPRADLDAWRRIKDTQRLLVEEVPEPIRRDLDAAQGHLDDILHERATVEKRAQKILDRLAHAELSKSAPDGRPARVQIYHLGNVKGVKPYELWVRRQSLSGFANLQHDGTPGPPWDASLVVLNEPNGGHVAANKARTEEILQDAINELGKDEAAQSLVQSAKALQDLAVRLYPAIEAELAKVPKRLE